MECTEAQSKFVSLFKGTIKGNELRKTYYHIVNCKKGCKEILLDEFSFYTTFNDLDKDLDFNYKRKLDELLDSIKMKIETGDSDKTIRYILISIAMCVAFVILVALAIRIVYI